MYEWGIIQRWLPLTGSCCEITHILASIHNRNEIPTAIPVFSTSGNTIRLIRKMLNVRKGKKSKLAAKGRDKFDYVKRFFPFKVCKYDSTYIFTNAIILGASVIFILSTLLPVFGYAIWFRKLPIHMSDCATNGIELAVRILYLSRTKLVYTLYYFFFMLAAIMLAVQDYIFPFMILALTA